MMVGATSWQIRGTYLDNVKLIANDLDFCELLVYTWDLPTEELLTKEIEAIIQKTTISVHLPTDALDNVKQAVAFFEGFDCLNLTVHPFAEFKRLADFYFDYSTGSSSNNLSLENLEDNMFNKFTDYLGQDKEKLNITMDYGHLLYTRDSLEAFYNEYASQICEIHFHGANQEKAHVYPDKASLEGFQTFMKTHDFPEALPICVELFHWPETKQLVKELKTYAR
ncbi:MAG: hypothetical protein U9N62_12920 [Thermotogota bacterium]|nr:hypothetical protein [Thermotogota bacterium]